MTTILVAPASAGGLPVSTPVAMDKIGTATPPATNDLLEYVKLDIGAPGSSTPLSASNPMPDNVAQVGGTAIPADGATDAGPSLKVGGKVTLNQGALPTALAASQRGPVMVDEYGRLRTVTNRPKLLGAYKFESGILAVSASASSSTSGLLWLINPVGSTVVAYVKKLMMTGWPTAASAFVTSPRITVERMTFIGTASGATITPAKRDSTDAANTCTVRTASTSLTITAGAPCGDFSIPAVLTAVGIHCPVDQYLYDSTDDDDYIVLRAGEGLVVRQADAGSSSDTRKYAVYGSWEER